MKRRNRVIQRIENDYAEFKKELLSLNSTEIYDRSYKIFCIEEIYIILMNGYEFTGEMIKRILSFRGNVLKQIYEEWTHVDFSHQEPFKNIIKDTFARLPERKVAYAA